MKKFEFSSFGKSGKGCEEQAIRVKTMPSSDNPNIIPETKNKQNIMAFNQDSYPFLNQENSSFFLFKTLVSLSLSNDKLQKVIKLCHPNIISLRKIVKSRPKQSCQGKGQTYYSFYYEIIQYGIKMISEEIQKNSKFTSIILALDLRKVISDVIEYLQKQGIFYAVKKEDIGIDREGTIKIYIPPNMVFDSKYDRSIMQRAFSDIVDWWKSVQDKCHRQMFRKDNQLGRIKLANNQSLKFSNAKVTQSFIKQESKEDMIEVKDKKNVKTGQLKHKHSLNSHIQQLAKLGELQLQKINKIDKQVKLIREKLVQQSKQHQKKLQTQRSTQKLLKHSYLKQNAKQQQPFLPRQSVQQNINCINIYNNTLPNFLVPNCYNYNYMPQPPTHPHRFDRNYHPDIQDNHDGSDSQDTYDIQFESQCQLPNAGVKKSYRNTLFSRLDNLSAEYSNREFKHSRQQSGNTFRDKQKKNQLFNPKKRTESAGPLQFKNIINKCIKPQFLAKKSNIYQVPGEDQSEKSDSPKRKQDNIYGLFANSNNEQRNLSKSFGNKLSPMIFSGRHIQAEIKRMATSNEFSNNRVKVNDKKPNVIEQKVKKVLQKTKNAIVLLNGVKNSREKGVKLFASKEK